MSANPAMRQFCKRAEAPIEDCVGYTLEPWIGAARDHGVSVSVIRKVQCFLQSRQAVMKLDELINKKDPLQVRYMMLELLAQKSPIQVAFLQGCIPLQHDDLFPRLLDMIAT